jgi:hypothetical protein
MPRDTIRRLSTDLERILVAGAHLAAGDQALAKDKTSLDGLAAQLGAKAPVIGQLAAATGKVLTANTRDAAREVVSLTTMAAQVRCAQAQPAAVPAPTALTPRPVIGTPCPAKVLGDLHNALIESGKGRMERVDQAIERGDIADLRLVDALVFAMADGYIGEQVTTKAIPRLGAAIVAPIRAKLDFAKGTVTDGRRLRALVAVQGAAARDLLRQALTEGNAELRAAAFEAVADHVRGEAEFEPLVLETIAKERNGTVRRAAVRALSGFASDASLAAVVAACDDPDTLDVAAEALGASQHPKAVDWILERLAAAVAALPAAEKAAKEAAKAAKAGTPVKAAKHVVSPGELIEALLRACARQRDPRIAAATLPLLAKHGVAAAQAVLGSADQAQRAAIADLLDGANDDLFPIAAKAAAGLAPAESFKRLTAAFKAKDREKKLGQARLEAVSDQLGALTNPTWIEFALKMLKEPLDMAFHVLPVLAAAKERRAVKPLIALLAGEPHAIVARPVIETLGAIGDPAAIPAIVAQHHHNDWHVRMAVRSAILAINDPAAVDHVRTAVVALKDANAYEHWPLRNLLDQLERAFPGR